MAGVESPDRLLRRAWLLLGAALLAVALYVRSHGLRIGLGFAVAVHPAPMHA